MKTKLCIVLLGSLLLGACVSPPRIDASSVNHMLELELPLVTESSAHRLPSPFSLGVYFKPPRNLDGLTPPDWAWSQKDKSHIFRVLARLQRLGVLNAYTELRIDDDGPFHAIEQAAAAANIDAILVLHGVGDVDAGRNRGARLYPLLLTTLFVPGDEVHSVFKAGVSVWDGDYRRSLLAFSKEGDKESSTPIWFVNEAETLASARNRATRKLRAPLYQAFVKLAFGDEELHD